MTKWPVDNRSCEPSRKHARRNRHGECAASCKPTLAARIVSGGGAFDDASGTQAWKRMIQLNRKIASLGTHAVSAIDTAIKVNVAHMTKDNVQA
jgi:hypothetical protein